MSNLFINLIFNNNCRRSANNTIRRNTVVTTAHSKKFVFSNYNKPVIYYLSLVNDIFLINLLSINENGIDITRDIKIAKITAIIPILENNIQ